MTHAALPRNGRDRAQIDRTLLRLATAGSVDDGKSTLVGRLLHDTDSVATDALDHVERISRRRGLERADLALLTDGLRAEREQGITIDVAYRYFTTTARKFILADCPGHVQYTRNTVTGASTADVIVLLVDARNGVVEQTRRHLAVAALLRVPHVLLAVNKIDLVDFDEAVFTTIATEFAILARSLGVSLTSCVPTSALDGDNVVTRSRRTPWYDGPTVLGFLESVDDTAAAVGADFRFPVQQVIRPQQAVRSPWAATTPPVDGDYRGYAGTVESGRISVGDEVVVLPRGSRARVDGIDTPDGPLATARSGQAVVLRLDRDLDVSRGDLLAGPDTPPVAVQEFTATLCWLAERPLNVGQRVLIQHGTAVVPAVVSELEASLELKLGPREHPSWVPTGQLELNAIGRVRVRLAGPLPIDDYRQHRRTGAFIVVDPTDGRTLAAGMAGPTTLNPPATADPATSPTAAKPLAER